MCKKILLCSMLMMLILSYTASARLVAHYKFNETSGSGAYDSAPVGLSPVGQISSGVILGEPGVPKLGGTSFRFTGNERVVLQSDGNVASDVNPDGAFTLTMWIRHPEGQELENTNFYKTQSGVGFAGDAGWMLKSQGGGFRVFLRTDDSNWASIQQAGVYPDNTETWWFVWLRYDENSAQLGALLDDPAGSDAAGIAASLISSNAAVGGAVRLSSFPVVVGGDGTDAWIDDVRLYDEALSDEELSDIYNNVNSTANNPTPSDGQMNVAMSTDLSWYAAEVFDDVTDPDNPVAVRDPNVTAHYVYILEAEPGATDPNMNDDALDPVTVADPGSDPVTLANASLPLTLQPDRLYFWRVDTAIDDSGPEDPGTVQGALWHFETQTSAPVVESFDNVLTAREFLPAVLSATVSHLTDSVTSVVFSADHPDVVLQNQNTDLYEPTIEVDLDPEGVAGTYTITLTVTDEAGNVVVDTADVAIYEDACQAAQAADDWDGFSPYDVNEDCKVDIEDLASFVLQWLDDQSLQSQMPY